MTSHRYLSINNLNYIDWSKQSMTIKINLFSTDLYMYMYTYVYIYTYAYNMQHSVAIFKGAWRTFTVVFYSLNRDSGLRIPLIVITCWKKKNPLLASYIKEQLHAKWPLSKDTENISRHIKAYETFQIFNTSSLCFIFIDSVGVLG